MTIFTQHLPIFKENTSHAYIFPRLYFRFTI